MRKKQIKESNTKILKRCHRAVESIRMQQYLYGIRHTKAVIDLLSHNMDAVLGEKDFFNQNMVLVDENAIAGMLAEMLRAMEERDYVYLADLLEMQCIPFVKALQEYLVSAAEVTIDEDRIRSNLAGLFKYEPALARKLGYAEENGQVQFDLDAFAEMVNKGAAEGYLPEYTSCGEMTLRIEREGRASYLHTNGMVFEEAGRLAEGWVEEDCYCYRIYGLGLGWHIEAMLEWEEAVSVTVYESDWNILVMAAAFSNMGQWISDRVHIIYDRDFSAISKIPASEPKEKFLVYYPSLCTISQSSCREWLEDYFINYSSIKTQLKKLNGNFYKNKALMEKSVEELEGGLSGKDLYIVAAGPSLDKNMEWLAKAAERGVVLATGTVLKKMLKAGIRPHYVIITDAGTGTYRQIEDAEDCGVPLLYLSTAYYKIPQAYQAEHYVICQQGYERAEKLAGDKGWKTYGTGGSVVTTALDIGICFGCKRIIFAGLDLAYTGGKDHAGDTAYVREVEGESGRMAEDIYGNQVPTGRNLDIYRKWIEKRVEQAKRCGCRTTFIDATEGGAKIRGMEIRKLETVVME